MNLPPDFLAWLVHSCSRQEVRERERGVGGGGGYGKVEIVISFITEYPFYTVGDKFYYFLLRFSSYVLKKVLLREAKQEGMHLSLFLSLSLSLSHTHTHTYTNTHKHSLTFSCPLSLSLSLSQRNRSTYPVSSLLLRATPQGPANCLCLP